MKLLIAVFLCATMLAACGKREDAPSKYDKIIEISNQASESSLKPTEEEWQSNAIGFTYKFRNGREVMCIRMYNGNSVTCDWSN